MNKQIDLFATEVDERFFELVKRIETLKKDGVIVEFITGTFARGASAWAPGSGRPSKPELFLHENYEYNEILKNVEECEEDLKKYFIALNKYHKKLFNKLKSHFENPPKEPIIL